MIEDSEPESIWDMRRKAPFHFLAKADNARMSAFILSHIEKDLEESLSSKAGYHGTFAVAAGEAFRREASIAIEMILKAVLCTKTKRKPPSTHDVYELWSKSGLPAASDDQSHRLADMTEILYWSGRYAAPNDDKNLLKGDERFEKHQKTKPFGKVKIIENTTLDWEDFDELYQIAARYFWELDPNNPNNFVA